MAGPGEYVPDVTEGISSPADLPPPRGRTELPHPGSVGRAECRAALEDRLGNGRAALVGKAARIEDPVTDLLAHEAT